MTVDLVDRMHNVIAFQQLLVDETRLPRSFTTCNKSICVIAGVCWQLQLLNFFELLFRLDSFLIDLCINFQLQFNAKHLL